ncbi:MAG: HEAT repeat domain-containing protein [Verrucomicrobiota bacterium]|nr:HEAT repeat domain-containing protein [Verrucomicrobiota bacterium]
MQVEQANWSKKGHKQGNRLKAGMLSHGFILGLLSAGVMASGEETTLPPGLRMERPHEIWPSDEARPKVRDLLPHLDFKPGTLRPARGKLSPDHWLYFFEKKKEEASTFLHRCRPDGRRHSIVARGLYAPVSLQFDSFGNVFFCDNLPAPSKRSRWIYLVEGAHYGWTKRDQANDAMPMHTPWQAKGWWQTNFEGQSASIMPPVAIIDMQALDHAAYPGTGFSETYDDHTFISGIQKTGPVIMKFLCEPSGPFFDMAHTDIFTSGIPRVELDFSTSGGLILKQTDTGKTSNKGMEGFRVFDPRLEYTPEIQSTARWLGADLQVQSHHHLIQLLEHPDMRVRLRAQDTLVSRSKEAMPHLIRKTRDPSHLLARLHAMWAIQQILEQAHHGQTEEAVGSLMHSLLQDPASEVRAQAAGMSGYLGDKSLVGALVEALDDPSGRVRQRAILALGRMNTREFFEILIDCMARPENQGAVLRQTAITVMERIANQHQLESLAEHPNDTVRLVAVVALRRLRGHGVERYLRDENPMIVMEAARAIHDTPIGEAMEALAGMHAVSSDWIAGLASVDEGLSFPSSEGKTSLQSDSVLLIPMLHRVYHANMLLGEAGNLEVLVEAVEDETLPLKIRSTCAQWITKRLHMGQDRDAPGKPFLIKLLRNRVETWITASNPFQRGTILACIRSAAWKQHTSLVEDRFHHFHEQPENRVRALWALSDWSESNMQELIDEALVSNSALLRKEAVLIQARFDPEDTVAAWVQTLESGNFPQKQAVLRTMVGVRDRRIDAVLLYWLQQVLEGSVDKAVHEELLALASTRTSPAVRKALADCRERQDP